MVLQTLYQAYERFEKDPDYELAPLGCSIQRISFAIVLENDGTLFDIQDIREQSGTKRIPRRVKVLGVNKPTGSGLSPCFLWDNTAYLLGVDKNKNGVNQNRALCAIEETRKRYRTVEKEIATPEFSAVCRFLESWDPLKAQSFAVLQELAGTFGVFQIRGSAAYVHEVPAITKWWFSRTQGDFEKMKTWWEAAPEKEPKRRGWCLLTGRSGTLVRLHEPRVKGVDGQQPTGATIAGFNFDAVESYGWTQAFNAPASQEAIFRSLTALNAMLEGPKRDRHRIVVGNTTVVFWTDKPSPAEDIFGRLAIHGSLALFEDQSQDEIVLKKIQAFLRALRQGREAYADLDEDPDRTQYRILGLSAPTPARIAVRFFHQSTLSDLLTNLRRHFQDISVEREFQPGAKFPDPEFPSIQRILDAMCPVRTGKPERVAVPAHIGSSLLEAIVTGKRYPEALYQGVLRRLASGESVNYGRACVLKGYLTRNLGKEIPMSLDEKKTDPAYLLGRLFAALEKTQEEALPGLSSTIRDRYYSAASATPRAVFPRILRGYQHHLAKLEGGFRINRERLVQDILASLSEFPAHLNMADQGLFALGYYHQRRAFYTKKVNDACCED